MTEVLETKDIAVRRMQNKTKRKEQTAGRDGSVTSDGSTDGKAGAVEAS